ncbi:MAG: hypothetical protein RR630_04025 [Coprobacillus sp.]
MYLIDKLELILKSNKNDSAEFILSEYFLNHLSDLRKLNLKKIAVETQLSKSSIIRFCQSSGCTGFTIFINGLQTEFEELKNMIQFYNHFDVKMYEETRNIFMRECEDSIEEWYKQLLSEVMNCKKIFFYGHSQYISCFKFLTLNSFVNKKEVITSMSWYKDNQRALFDQSTDKDIIIIMEPQKDWRSYKELLVIYEDALNDLAKIKAKKIFIGQGKNNEIDISISIPYTYYEPFYKEFLMKLDMKLAIDLNNKNSVEDQE